LRRRGRAAKLGRGCSGCPGWLTWPARRSTCALMMQSDQCGAKFLGLGAWGVVGERHDRRLIWYDRSRAARASIRIIWRCSVWFRAQVMESVQALGPRSSYALQSTLTSSHAQSAAVLAKKSQAPPYLKNWLHILHACLLPPWYPIALTSCLAQHPFARFLAEACARGTRTSCLPLCT
jgi:hypothetical protein